MSYYSTRTGMKYNSPIVERQYQRLESYDQAGMMHDDSGRASLTTHHSEQDSEYSGSVSPLAPPQEVQIERLEEDEFFKRNVPSTSRKHFNRSIITIGFRFVACWTFILMGSVFYRSLKEITNIVGLMREQELQFNEIMALQNFLPQNWSQLELKWTERVNQSWSLFNESMGTSYWKIQEKRKRAGYQLFHDHGVTGKYPVVMIPGFVTSGLEMWKGAECASKFNLRQRMWGSMDGFSTMFIDRPCWQQHLALDPFTGSDPEGTRVRAADSFQGANYFVANFWVWEKLIQNLADIGYDASTMSMETYDWRLSFPMLEKRDGYLTKLKHKIEAFHETTGEKVVLTSHSMGGQLVHYFFNWVTTDKKRGGGGGGKKWVDKHIHVYVNIAGPHLGVPKAASALLSGEMKDTVIMGTVGSILEQFFSRLNRKDLFNTWGSLWGMLPIGGDNVWGAGADLCNGSSDSGNAETYCVGVMSEDKEKANQVKDYYDGDVQGNVPLIVITDEEGDQQGDSQGDLEREQFQDESADDESVEEEKVNDESADNDPSADDEITDSALIVQDSSAKLAVHARLNETVQRFATGKAHSTSETVDFLLRWGGSLGSSIWSSRLFTEKQPTTGMTSMAWLNPLETPLPYAPKMKIYCLYGVGLDTERSYFYKRNSGKAYNSEENSTGQTNWQNQVDLPLVLDTMYEDPEKNIRHGIRFSNGDASVPLLSLGYVCVDAWNPRNKDSRLNPSRAEVITREYQHRQEFSVEDPMRGGPASADHVDILGNLEMTEDFLRIVSDFDPKVENRIVSNIKEIAQKVNSHSRKAMKKKQRRWFGLGEL